MDDIREWISDNLRYILLGLALILVLVVAVLAIRAISNIAAGKNPLPVAQSTEAQTDTPQDVIVETEDGAQQNSSLTENDAKVLTAMTSYYNARTNGDTETMRKLNPSMDEQEEANLASNYVERYSNIRTYSKPGLTEGSYVAYVCYDGKVRDIDTEVPSLIEYYLMTDESGNLYIADTDGNAEIEKFCVDTQQTAEVQNLINSVNQDLQEAEDSDPALAKFMAQYGNSSGGESTEESEKGEPTEIVALDSCNIRSEPSTESDDNIIGSLYVGDTATKLGEQDGWTEIDFNGESAWVSSDFVATPEEAQEADEASYFQPAAAEAEEPDILGAY